MGGAHRSDNSGANLKASDLLSISQARDVYGFIDILKQEITDSISAHIPPLLARA